MPRPIAAEPSTPRTIERPFIPGSLKECCHPIAIAMAGRRGIATSPAICQSARKIDPRSASKIDPSSGLHDGVALAPAELVGVVEPGRARWREERSLEGQARFLKRQLSLPVSTMSQWCVRRSSNAVVILGFPINAEYPHCRWIGVRSADYLSAPWAVWPSPSDSGAEIGTRPKIRHGAVARWPQTLDSTLDYGSGGGTFYAGS
jgi:hypothetical protein